MVWARRWLGSATGAEPSSDARAADAPSGGQSPHQGRVAIFFLETMVYIMFFLERSEE